MTDLRPAQSLIASDGPHSVLVAEDDAVFRRVLESLLKRASFDVTVVNNGTDALDIARRPKAPRLLILDWMMPGLYGPEICRLLRKHPGSELYQYILLLTAKDAKTDTVEGLEAGADDYLTKPFDAQELLARLRTGKRILELQDRLLDAKRAVEYQATHDPLTGLWNRVAWPKLLAGEWERARRSHSSLSALMIDIDHFKAVNDRYGHTCGDEVLRRVADTLLRAVRAYDIAGRYGGEEFIVIAPQLSPDAACEYAERIRAEIAGTKVPLQESTISVTVSVGVAQVHSVEDCDGEALIRIADAALYEAKMRGRDLAVLANIPITRSIIPNSQPQLATVE